jgi:hypothetical protein
METIMEVKNEKTMCILLSALGLSTPDGYEEKGEVIEIKISRENLMYAMVSSEEEIQYIFGSIPEWQELIALWK